MNIIDDKNSSFALVYFYLGNTKTDDKNSSFALWYFYLGNTKTRTKKSGKMDNAII